jgi:hypothetical protein
MRQPIIDLTGQRFGRWLVQSQAGRNRHGQAMHLAICDCGTTRIISGNHLKSGQSRSCGCIRQDRIDRRRKVKALVVAMLRLRDLAS